MEIHRIDSTFQEPCDDIRAVEFPGLVAQEQQVFAMECFGKALTDKALSDLLSRELTDDESLACRKCTALTYMMGGVEYLQRHQDPIVIVELDTFVESEKNNEGLRLSVESHVEENLAEWYQDAPWWNKEHNKFQFGLLAEEFSDKHQEYSNLTLELDNLLNGPINSEMMSNFYTVLKNPKLLAYLPFYKEEEPKKKSITLSRFANRLKLFRSLATHEQYTVYSLFSSIGDVLVEDMSEQLTQKLANSSLPGLGAENRQLLADGMVAFYAWMREQGLSLKQIAEFQKQNQQRGS